MVSKALTLPADYPTGVLIESPDSGKVQYYAFKEIINEEYERVDIWSQGHPAPQPVEVVRMLLDIATLWASEDLAADKFDDLLPLQPREVNNLKITYVCERAHR